MRPRDLFGVGLRLLGVWFVCESAFYLPRIILSLARSGSVSTVLTTSDKLIVGFLLLAGFLLLGLADKIATLCYGPDKN